MTTNIKGIKLDTRILDRLTKEAQPKARQIVNTYGLAITGDAAKIAPRDPARPPQNLEPLNTGALRNSITSESGMTGEMTFTVQDGVEYGVFQELGTSKMPARPFLLPAVEKWTQKFLDAFAEIMK